MRERIFQHPSFDNSIEFHALVGSSAFAPFTLPSRNSWFLVFMCCSRVSRLTGFVQKSAVFCFAPICNS